MNLRLFPSKLSGSIAAIPSKSDFHRKLILAALSNSKTTLSFLEGFTLSDDILATISCLTALGANITVTDGNIIVFPIKTTPDSPVLNCNESGTTLRLLLPVAAALSSTFSVTGSGRLPSRPIKELCQALEKNGCCFSSNALPFTVTGKLSPGLFSLPGNISSQYLSGILLAMPLLSKPSKLIVSPPIESFGYLEMTMHTMALFHAPVIMEGTTFSVNGRYESDGEYSIEGDFSNAAFWFGANYLGHTVAVEGLANASLQPDRVAKELFSKLGNNAMIDVHACPDLVPILAVCAACAKGKTTFLNASRLRIKESDRLSSLQKGFHALGIQTEETEDSLSVYGGKVHGGVVSSANDHRLAMAWAILALNADAPILLQHAEAINKSYPQFLEHYQLLGGKYDVL